MSCSRRRARRLRGWKNSTRSTSVMSVNQAGSRRLLWGLDRQSKTAKRHERLKDDERRTSAELLALRLRELDQRANDSQRGLSEQETALEAEVAKQRKIEAEIEQLRVAQNERSDEFNEVQARFYKAGAEIARLEQAIEHAHELRERQQKDLEQAIHGAKEIAGHINQDMSEIEQLELSLSELSPGLEQARQSEKLSLESLQSAEHALADWQSLWDDYTDKSNHAQQIRNVEQTRAEEIESRIKSFSDRHQKLVTVETDASPEDLRKSFEKIEKQEVRKRQAIGEFDRALADIGDKIKKLREQDVKLNRLVDERRGALVAVEAKYASLEAVQKAALGQGDEAIKSWLKASGLDESQRVAQLLDVENGWERAVETVLGQYLQAVCVSDVATATASLAQLKAGHVTLLLDQSESTSSDDDSDVLISKIKKAPAAVSELLQSVQIADSLEKALVVREELQDGKSVITPDGVWLSKHWLRVSRDKDAKSGVLSREHDMRRLKADIREAKARSDGARKLVQDGRIRMNQLEERREKLQQNAVSLLNEYSELKANLDSARYRMDQADARQAAITEERSDIEKEQFSAEELARESRSRFEQASEYLTELEVHRNALESQRDELRAELDRVRSQADEDRQTAQEIAIQFESRRSTKDSAAQNLGRMQSQLEQFQAREVEIRGQLEQSETPLAASKSSLGEQLKARITVEEELADARRRVEEVEHNLREFDRERMQADQSVEEVRGHVDTARMAFQEIRVRREGISDQLAQTDFELDSLLDNLSEEIEIEGWEEKLEKVRRRIDRLGPINLAAIDEYKEQSERKEYLDSQLNDLNTALDTLQRAIRKIDRETRTRFRETYANVDKGFKRLFPKLFGGGHAYLELTGDDLLSAGVTVMARPPGKRNSTIHLLSGGEKALTAVALVFAIFELNPAPFCLLDEVDAPLDDANVHRFCDIVKEMAEKVQFVFITHNKGTMEMARQLTGVTMQEPGVSRVVSVDLDEAVKMAAS